MHMSKGFSVVRCSAEMLDSWCWPLVIKSAGACSCNKLLCDDGIGSNMLRDGNPSANLPNDLLGDAGDAVPYDDGLCSLKFLDNGATPNTPEKQCNGIPSPKLPNELLGDADGLCSLADGGPEKLCNCIPSAKLPKDVVREATEKLLNCMDAGRDNDGRIGSEMFLDDGIPPAKLPEDVLLGAAEKFLDVDDDLSNGIDKLTDGIGPAAICADKMWDDDEPSCWMMTSSAFPPTTGVPSCLAD